MRRALLIIDVQEAMIPVLWRGAELVERLAKLARQARDHDVPVMMIQQTGPPGSPFDPTTPGWQPPAQLRLAPTDLRIHKTATDSFFDTELASALTARAITTVIICGAATDYCVDATVRAAVSCGLGVDLVSDGHSPAISGDPDAQLTPEQIIAHHNRILSQAIHPGGAVRLVRADEVF